MVMLPFVKLGFPLCVGGVGIRRVFFLFWEVFVCVCVFQMTRKYQEIRYFIHLEYILSYYWVTVSVGKVTVCSPGNEHISKVLVLVEF